MASLLVEIFTVIALVLWQGLKSFFQFFVPPPRKDIDGEIIFLTGAGSGLGRMLAFKFAKLGAIVICVDINQTANEATVEEIKALGFQARGYKCDCSSRDDIYRVAELVKNEVGEVTILINNAGIVSGKKFMETEDWKIQKTFEVNTMAHFWVSYIDVVFVRRTEKHFANIPSARGVNVRTLCAVIRSWFLRHFCRFLHRVRNSQVFHSNHVVVLLVASFHQ